ncbi:MAG: OmpA family protein [Bacteriovoracaceae bacterium]|nr:OmpA family protein [Bacteriovoracaceae bacterium]
MKSLNILMILIILLASCATLYKKEIYTVQFKSGSVKIPNRSNLRKIKNALDSKTAYQIRGYTCKEDSSKLYQKLNISEQRAKLVKSELIRLGFPKNKLETIAFDQSINCKVEIHSIN